MRGNTKKQVDVRDVVSKGMARDRQKLLMRQPFIGVVMMHLDFIPVISGDEVGSSVVTAGTDGEKVYMNCDFYQALSAEERLFVLAHEVWHCVLLHFVRRQERDPTRFNLATDIEIHFILQKEGLKEPYVLPHNPAWDGLSAEEIYERILTCKSSRQLDPGRESENLHSQDSGEGFDQHPFDSGGGFDQHLFDGDAREQKNRAERMRRIVIQTAQQMERRGELPAYLQSVVARLRRPELNWRELLRQFVTSALGDERRWTPPARRYLPQGLYLPTRRGMRLNCVVAVDTSSSTTRLLPRFFTELSSLLNSFGNYELTVIQCDAEIHKVETFSDEHLLNGRKEWDVYGYGGTNLCPPFDYVRENHLSPDVFIYLTDGFGPAPDNAPAYPVMWILPQNGARPATWGRAVRIKNEEE